MLFCYSGISSSHFVSSLAEAVSLPLCCLTSQPMHYSHENAKSSCNSQKHFATMLHADPLSMSMSMELSPFLVFLSSYSSSVVRSCFPAAAARLSAAVSPPPLAETSAPVPPCVASDALHCLLDHDLDLSLSCVFLQCSCAWSMVASPFHKVASRGTIHIHLTTNPTNPSTRRGKLRRELRRPSFSRFQRHMAHRLCL